MTQAKRRFFRASRSTKDRFVFLTCGVPERHRGCDNQQRHSADIHPVPAEEMDKRTRRQRTAGDHSIDDLVHHTLGLGAFRRRIGGGHQAGGGGEGEEPAAATVAWRYAAGAGRGGIKLRRCEGADAHAAAG